MACKVVPFVPKIFMLVQKSAQYHAAIDSIPVASILGSCNDL